MKNDGLDDLNNRQLQCYAAMCMRAYCEAKGITHPAIDELFSHLVDVLSTDNLPDWETTGAGLTAPGRGNPIPNSVSDAVPADCREEFGRLVDDCVEVGIVDMYCADSDYPVDFARNCRGILRKQGVPTPSLTFIRGLGDCFPGWNEPYCGEEVKRILSRLQNPR